MEASRLEAAFASLPSKPSIEKTNGVKVQRRAMQSAPYLSFFPFRAGEELWQDLYCDWMAGLYP